MAKGKKPPVPPVSNSNPTNVKKTAFKQKKSNKALKNRRFVPSTIPQPPPRQRATPSPPPSAPTAPTAPTAQLPIICKNPYSPLPGPLETSMMKVAYVQFRFKSLLLLLLHSFLCSKGLASPSQVDIDLQDVLRIINRKNTADPAGFLHRPLTPNEVDKVILVRNNTDHINLNNVDRNWQTEVPAYVLLCNSISEPGVAAEIQSMIDRMMAGVLDGLVEFSFQFTPAFTYEKAFGLSQIVYGVLLAFLAKEIWTFLKAKLGINNITLDLYANLKFIKNQLKVNADFFAPGGASRGDENLVETVYDTRMDNAHGGYTRATADWRVQLESVVQILDLINKHDVALEVQVIMDRLVALETAGATVTQVDFKFMED
ncbi:hypothetical protein DAPPUDRAFT_105439 [Daphnia pulex]|uniref:Uncharacterized protein n=1 Tax=Daphnia pulex TaxID=6669 RepID=E9GQT8_DAPPU|nr:hypothetical protein DAPPUDRAFT_105439 [Daphnia pulex]|eukprot:EFX78172.1 hypothetical protein DAPPUDRAFT_105439 [Daphnia pulex]